MIVATKDESCNAMRKDFPKLMIAPNNEVVLFNCSGCGVVVVPTSKAAGSVVGHFSKAWNMENFTLYTGEVTLKNG